MHEVVIYPVDGALTKTYVSYDSKMLVFFTENGPVFAQNEHILGPEVFYARHFDESV